MKTSKTTAFTLIELLVVISIIAILAGIALPVFGSVQVKGAQTKALSNAKQIGTALRLFAVDNNGVYPSYGLTNGKQDQTKKLEDSNTAFAQLIPDYLPSEDIFWLSKSKWCNVSTPDNKVDPAGTDTPAETLKGGDNEWAYVPGLSDTSNPSFPIIADGFNNLSGHVYSVNETDRGGVWRGKAAIVIRCDSSGAVLKTSKAPSGTTTTYLKGPIGGSSDDDIFKTGQDGWLGTTNEAVNPKSPSGT
jgi:prepilin-type N-terminal cleavage/methylation domain-containing protein